MTILRMTDLDLAGKRVLIREDLNVPIEDGRITSEQRITAALPTMTRSMPLRSRSSTTAVERTPPPTWMLSAR